MLSPCVGCCEFLFVNPDYEDDEPVSSPLFQPKAMTAFLSGEMKDTVELNPAGAYGLSFSSFFCTIYASK